MRQRSAHRQHAGADEAVLHIGANERHRHLASGGEARPHGQPQIFAPSLLGRLLHRRRCKEVGACDRADANGKQVARLPSQRLTLNTKAGRIWAMPLSSRRIQNERRATHLR